MARRCSAAAPFAVNKVVILMWVSAALAFRACSSAAASRQLVPTGVQNVAESTVDFVEDGIVMQTIGPDGLQVHAVPAHAVHLHLHLQHLGIIPVVQMPVNARIALPMFMALLVWVIYNVVGIIKQGPLSYFKNILFPPGVPKALLHPR